MEEYNYSAKFNPSAPVLELSISIPSSIDSITTLGLVDSGADITVIPQHIVSRLKLRRVDFALAAGFIKEVKEVPIYSAVLHIKEVLRPRIYRVLSWNEDYALIGRDLLNQLVAILNGPHTKLALEI